jgi:4-alpha-glucanotransferase
MKIRFSIWYPTEWGQQAYVVGNIPELGLGDIKNALCLRYSPGAEWSADVALPKNKGAQFEYKYIIKNDDNVVLAEEPRARKFSLSEPEAKEFESVHIRDAWRKYSDSQNLFLTSAFSEVIFKRKDQSSQAVKKRSPANLKTVIRLQITVARIEPEHKVSVFGSILLLGMWDANKAQDLVYQENALWSVDLHVKEQDLPFTYRYIIKDKKDKLVLTEEGYTRDVIYGVGKETGRGQKRLIVVTDEKFGYPKDWRGAGVAVPVFSLRTKDSLGVGEFPDLKLLADWASSAGLRLIQTLPVNDTSVYLMWWDSYPYSDLSVFALHPLYLNLSMIGALPKNISDEIESQKKTLNAYDHVDYEEVMKVKSALTQEIFKAAKDGFLACAEFREFFKENSFWLAPYAAFCMLRDKYKTSDFRAWEKYSKITDEGIRALTSPQSEDYERIALYYFLQYHLHKQLREASEYAKTMGVILKGDIPIGINKHSDSCWLHPHLFHMGQSAGAPPDPFSDVGQNWGFPTYDWEAMAGDDYAWWRVRLKQMSRYFQMVRLDHVLGFFRIWEIPEYNFSGLMGHFNPAIPLWRQELEAEGIWDFNRLTEPYIPVWLVRMIFGPQAQYVIATYLEEKSPQHYRLKPEFSTQKQVAQFLVLPENANPELKAKNEMLKAGLFSLIMNVILFPDARMDGFHPRINMMDTCSFACLDTWEKEKLLHFYNDYFYHRQEDFWRAQAMKKLPVLKDASRMLICGEDLGMIPDCVPKAMEELCMVGLRIQRMPRETDREFGIPKDYPYLTVCTTSSHDMSTIRGWWGEDYSRAKRYYNTVLGHSGDAPSACTPEIVCQVITQHLESASMWAVFPLQDILGLDKGLCRPGDPREEQINDPANPHHYWKFRMHLTLEKLIEQKDFNERLKEMVARSGRHDPY